MQWFYWFIFHFLREFFQHSIFSFSQCYFQLLCIIFFNWQTTTGLSKKTTGHTKKITGPTKITQITFPITGQTTLVNRRKHKQQQKNKNKKKQAKGKNPKLIREFPLQHLMHIGLTSSRSTILWKMYYSDLELFIQENAFFSWICNISFLSCLNKVL